jgi:ribose transport system ATP-binding protein
MILSAKHISKTFGSTRALHDVSIDMEVGKVHALVGENGAGKSTLFKILSGYVPKDSGTVELKGEQIDPQTHLETKKNNIVLVHQELNINTSLGIAENIFLDRMRKFSNVFGILRRNEMCERAQEILDDIEVKIDVKESIQSLDLGQLKIIQVAQALSKNPEIIFLDESTAYLNIAEIKSLLKVIESLKDRGIAIGFVSHHLDEVEMIADKLTILKDGCLVGVYSVGNISLKKMESLMVGREGDFVFSKRDNFEESQIIFSANNISVPKQLDDISFSVKKGEILGFGGLKGAGGESVLKMILGEIFPSRGTMELEGKSYAPQYPYDAYSVGISYLPGNRQTEGLITKFSIKSNIIMTAIPRKGLFVDESIADNKTKYYKQLLNIKTDDVFAPCESLSGGNMQKVVLAKCLLPNPKMLLLNNPTRGIDVAARYEIYRKIQELSREQGLTVVILTEDLIELIGLCDRILIFKMKKISKEFGSGDYPTEHEAVSYMI